MTNPKFLFSKKQAAEALSLSLRTIDNLIAAKRIAVTKIGRRVLIPRKSLQQLADDKKLVPTHGTPAE